jgi:hypothetical protein
VDSQHVVDLFVTRLFPPGAGAPVLGAPNSAATWVEVNSAHELMLSNCALLCVPLDDAEPEFDGGEVLPVLVSVPPPHPVTSAMATSISVTHPNLTIVDPQSDPPNYLQSNHGQF